MYIDTFSSVFNSSWFPNTSAIVNCIFNCITNSKSPHVCVCLMDWVWLCDGAILTHLASFTFFRLWSPVPPPSAHTLFCRQALFIFYLFLTFFRCFVFFVVPRFSLLTLFREFGPTMEDFFRAPFFCLLLVHWSVNAGYTKKKNCCILVSKLKNF